MLKQKKLAYDSIPIRTICKCPNQFRIFLLWNHLPYLIPHQSVWYHCIFHGLVPFVTWFQWFLLMYWRRIISVCFCETIKAISSFYYRYCKTVWNLTLNHIPTHQKDERRKVNTNLLRQTCNTKGESWIKVFQIQLMQSNYKWSSCIWMDWWSSYMKGWSASSVVEAKTRISEICMQHIQDCMVKRQHRSKSQMRYTV